ncbi:hybrid sensor histidine kinase/response regulator transcription factor [Ancylomarina sp. 16SWW S1-10-2]|uniref:hybrid sensor histidine kinase/response regulator n=1 Tax=Ancylomarina sp. 16SWW S1-10-2 TaxID=2499681 RepID=UPI0012AE7A0C|nr:hybrid sensor histidine kinase/response regulator transcription factor [Ancylomarina sp. 16SWW S1-10-2]MRT92046.1 hybrid sensor histidine kinase/response regulator [Ancylomarina sp. 16SWW S1-10-2]
MYKSIVIVIVLFMLHFGSKAQKQYSFLQVNNEDGLVSNQVTCVHKDLHGFIWIGTRAGLSRYDGSVIVNYKHNSSDSTSIPDNYIKGIQEDVKGNLVILTSKGYIVYDVYKERFYAEANKYFGLNKEPTFTDKIYCDNNKEVWIKPRSESHFLKYTAVDSTLHRVFPNNRVENFKVLDFIHANHEYYYLLNNGLIECYDDSTYELKFTDDYLLGNIGGGSLVSGLFVDNEKDIWVYGNDNGVYHFTSKDRKWNNYSSKTKKLSLSGDIVYKIIQDDKGLIWIAMDHGGINIINKQSGEITKIYHQSDNSKSIADNSVSDLFMDNNHIIWAATNKNGLSYYHENINKFPHYRNLLSDKKSLPFSDVNCFVEDPKGNLWIGTNGGGLVYFDRKKNTYVSYKHNENDITSISSNVVMSLLVDHNNELWIGTYAGGVNRFDGKRFKRYQFSVNSLDGLVSNNVWSVIEDDNLNIWIGTNGGGIEIYNKEKDAFFEIPNKGKLILPTKHISNLCKLADGNVFVGTAYGTFIYDTKKQSYRRPPGINDNTHFKFIHKSVNCLFEDSRGLLWIASNEGLIVINPRTSFIKLFTNEDGLPEDIMNCIEEDEFHSIWVSKSSGLSQIRVNKFSRNDEYSFQISNFTEGDGLQANEFNPNASYKTSNNELIFGGINGFNLFMTKNIKSNRILPKLVFTDFRVYNQSISPNLEVRNVKLLDQSIIFSDKIELKRSMNVFSIGFAALDFIISDKIKYKYKLEGFNDKWLIIDNNKPSVTYTNLSAGDYIFKVKVSYEDGVWNEEYAQLNITVLPPFYGTKLAFVIYALIVILLFVYYRYLMKRKEKLKFAIEQERLLAKQNHEMDEMKLRFLTNVSHEFRTPLTLIITPLQRLLARVESSKNKKLLEVMDRNAKSLLDLVNQLLDFRKLELHGMRYNPSYGNIISFLDGVLENIREGFIKKNIELVFRHKLDQFMFHFDDDKLQKVMMNLLSNALKFTQEKGIVTLEVNVDEHKKMVDISLTDTGVGIQKEDIDKVFVRFYQSENNKKLGLSGSGIGLNLAREMVQLHNGSICVESEEGVGSKFIVSLPIEHAEENVIEDKEQDHAIEYIAEKDQKTTAKEKSVILLVEDNLDFRTFMKETLQDDFIVYEAADGQIGYDTVHNVLPDLIISDVMMPNVDGLELCQMLRKDIRTSHIPIILLTARIADEDKIKGLEIGADDYITKPFNMDLLMLRINNLLKKRSKMQKQFQKTVNINPSEVQITSMDEKLIKKAVALVEENIAEASFSVEDLSKELGMSRVYLYKKLISITGKSPIEFIRIIRLKRGAQLLEKSQMNIAEVAYEVGFNSPRYFSKYFKEEYGMLPSAYVKAKEKGK